MNYSTKLSLFLAVATLSFSQLSYGILWTAGHGDIGIGYADEDVPGTFELEPHWHLGHGNESVTLDGTPTTYGLEGEEFEADAIRPLTNVTQTIEGTSYYVFPLTENPSIPYIGFGTEELNPLKWVGDLTLTLTGLSGSPGDFYLFGVPTGEFGGVPILMDSSDGFSPADNILLEVFSHTHYTMAFSQTGNYDLTFQVTGEHVDDGFQSATATYGFRVIPEPSTAGFLLGAVALALTMVRRRVS